MGWARLALARGITSYGIAGIIPSSDPWAGIWGIPNYGAYGTRGR